MTQTLGTNSTNDIYLGSDGNIVVLQGLAAVEGACATASKSILGEQVLSIGAGLPMFQCIWNGAPNIPLYVNYLQRTIENISGVTKIDSITTQILDSVFSYRATIETTFGIGTVAAAVNQP